MLTRRAALKALAGSLLVCGAAGAEPRTNSPEDAAAKGRRFLGGLLDPALGLLPEYRGAKVYWLYHDNYLAAKALARTDPDLARKIGATIRSHGTEESDKIEILFGEAKKPLPFRHYRLTEVKRVGDKVLKTEVAGEEVIRGWEQYADLLFLAALALAQTDAKQARQHFEEGMRLWDGVGFKDRVTKRTGRYAVYKVALALLAATKLKLRPDEQPALIERLLREQGEDGGWVTDYDERGRPLGRANVETTSLAILALDALTADDQPPRFTITTKRKDDSVEVQVNKDKVVFVVKSPFGISQSVIERQEEKWPTEVVVQLHLKGLERFDAGSSRVTLHATAGIRDGKPDVRLWKDDKEAEGLKRTDPPWTDIRILGGDGKPAKAVPLKGGYFEVALPRALFEGSPKSITLNWTDFYR
jgi:hypothetical protein